MDFVPSSWNKGVNEDVDERIRHTRVLIDSRDRMVATYPSANDFVMRLNTSFRAVRSIEMLDMWCPIIADTTTTSYTYVIPTLCETPDNSMAMLQDGTSYPGGTLATVYLVPCATGYAYSCYFESPNRWKLVFPNALSRLTSLHLQLWTWAGDSAGTGWGGSTFPPILYPLANESTASRPAKTNNYVMTLMITHEL